MRRCPFGRPILPIAIAGRFAEVLKQGSFAHHEKMRADCGADWEAEECNVACPPTKASPFGPCRRWRASFHRAEMPRTKPHCHGPATSRLIAKFVRPISESFDRNSWLRS